MIKVINESFKKADPNSWQYKELAKLGCDMDKAEVDTKEGSYYGIRVDQDKLKKAGYKYIETTSSDYTAANYTNGKYVVTSIAATVGYTSIQKLGSKAKKVIDSGEVFDIFNMSFNESLENDNESAMNESSSKNKSIQEYLLKAKNELEKYDNKVKTTDEYKDALSSINVAMYKVGLLENDTNESVANGSISSDDEKIMNESYDQEVFKKLNKKKDVPEGEDEDEWVTDGRGYVYKIPNEGYSPEIKKGAFLFRYNYKHKVLEVIDPENKKNVLASRGLSAYDWFDGPEHWVEMYLDELEEELSHMEF